jgi:hypothetical protein
MCLPALNRVRVCDDIALYNAPAGNPLLLYGLWFC